ncbi:LCP family protein [Miniphocaeibacter massiliensis]|uniref:LCP family protein n=1 Tax=Miniphocaeibacter massiliensis TaxID=2041841 RepID=UPI000C1C7DD7|nr:LCP family protein [Miniphocaeibacter massiliensis]
MKLRSIVVFFVSLLIFGGAYFVIDRFVDLSSQTLVEINPEDLGEGNIIDEFGDDLLFLLIGVDENEDAIGDAKNKHVRTDTMMLVNMNFETGDIKIISIPRDTMVKYKGESMKINGAHSHDGPTGALNAVRKLTGLDVDYYMSVNYKAVTDIVDTIGGVEVDSPVRIRPRGTEIVIPEGKSTLDGEKALHFVRAREVLPTGSDLARVENQQYFMKQLVDTVLQPSNILKIGKIFDVYKENVTTNIDLSKFKISDMATIASSFGKEKMETKTLPIAIPEGKSYVLPKKKEIATLMANWFPDYILDKNQLDKYEDGNYSDDSDDSVSYNKNKSNNNKKSYNSNN